MSHALTQTPTIASLHRYSGRTAATPRRGRRTRVSAAAAAAAAATAGRVGLRDESLHLLSGSQADAEALPEVVLPPGFLWRCAPRGLAYALLGPLSERRAAGDDARALLTTVASLPLLGGGAHVLRRYRP